MIRIATFLFIQQNFHTLDFSRVFASVKYFFEVIVASKSRSPVPRQALLPSNFPWLCLLTEPCCIGIPCETHKLSSRSRSPRWGHYHRQRSSMEIRVIRDAISRDELLEIAKQQFGDMVKAVVDVERSIMAISGELHRMRKRFFWTKGLSNGTYGE